jgi:hypothetical protein
VGRRGDNCTAGLCSPCYTAGCEQEVDELQE